jgi:hypothetical protein
MTAAHTSPDATGKPAEAAAHRCARMRQHLEQARDLLCLANRRGVRIPDEVLAPVIEADRLCGAGQDIDLALETRFWKAYGILRSTIEPATGARRLYRCVFYVSLALMLLCQFYFLFGSAVHRQLTQLREQSYVLSGQLQTTMPAPPAVVVGALPVESSEVIERRLTQNRLDREAYARLASWVVWLPSEQLEVSLATLEIVLDFLATYVLPALYGLLGACAFVLRQLGTDISRLSFADDLKVRYTLRLNIGLLAGLAVGWFITPEQNASVVANLSPLALAFVAGYGSDLLFAALDRIVNAFSAPPAAQSAEDHPAAREAAAAGSAPRPPAARSNRRRRAGANGAAAGPEGALAH